MKDKKNIIKILLAILIAVVIGIIIFVVCTNLNLNSGNKNGDNKEQNQNNSKPNKIEQEPTTDLSIDDEFVQKMYYTHAFLIKGYNEDLEKEMYENGISKVSDYSKEMKSYLFTYNWLMREVEPTSVDDEKRHYSSQVVLEKWKEFFGENEKFTLAGTGDESVGYKEDGSFYFCQNCGGPSGLLLTRNTLIKATKSESQIVLYENVEFLKETVGGVAVYYNDYELTETVTEETKQTANYQFIYKKDKNGNYYFYKVLKNYAS